MTRRLHIASGTRGPWHVLLLGADVLVIMVATIVTYFARFESAIPVEYAIWIPWMMLVSVVVYVVFAWAFGLYWIILRYAGVDTLLRSAGAVACGFGVLSAGDLLVGALRAGQRPVPIGIVLIQSVFVFIGIAGIRVAFRAVQHVRVQGRRSTDESRRMFILGAGSAGSLLLRELQARPELDVTVVGFLDDDRSLGGSIIGGVRVLGTIGDLEKLAVEYEVGQLFVALPGADPAYVRQILNRAADLGLTTRIMPKLVIEKGHVRLSDMRKVDVEDLLGRELTPIDVGEVESTIAGKVVAVTGAAGSIGAELCRQIIRMSPARLLLLELDESRLYELWLELEALQPGIARMHILDVRDADKIDVLFEQHKPNVLLHAAAYKHVPLMELEPSEAVRTNVTGTRNILDACVRHGVERFVLISTDKAVAPTGVMGKTKEIAERLMLDRVRAGAGTVCVAVRFGNVLGSRGSVVPIFEEELLRGEPLTVTHPEATRYFMLIPEAARLVLQAQAIGSSGDILVLEMGEPVRIADLAHRMIALSGIPAEVVFTGLRPGERIHETLHTADETLEPTSREKILQIVGAGPAALDARRLQSLEEGAARGLLSPGDVLEV